MSTPTGIVNLACGHTRKVFYPASKVEKGDTAHCPECKVQKVVVSRHIKVVEKEVLDMLRDEMFQRYGMEPVYDTRCFSHGEPCITGHLCHEGCDIQKVLIGAKVKEIKHP